MQGHLTTIPPEAYFAEQQGYCFFLLQAANLDFILLGDTFLRGSEIIHDMDNNRVGLYPQKEIEFSGIKLGNILIGISIGLNVIGLGVYAFIKFRKMGNQKMANYQTI